jgi:hypothetical protein
MKTRTYRVELTGVSPLLMHRDNLEWAAKLKAWQDNPQNKKNSVAGDDRTPAWRWIGCLSDDGKHISLDADNLMTMLREGGRAVPTGKGQSTFKAATQSGMVVNEIGWPLAGAKGLITMQAVERLRSVDDFDEHCTAVAELGFSLFAKRARVGQAKHVRVRPRFDVWTAAGTLTVLDDRISRGVLENILAQAGAYAGLCDWRPSSPKSPGPFGRFTAAITEAQR